MRSLTRRDVVMGMAASAAAGAMSGNFAEAAKACPGLPKWKNADFYKGGEFDAEAAKKAYYTLMEYHKFPILPMLKTDQFWTLDFGLGNFMEVGMAGTFYINDKRDNYLLHDIWLLPGQMIPEHWHVKTETVEAKMEAWLVRHGMAYMFSVGEPNPGDEKLIPPLHKKIAKARKATKTEPGQVVKLEVAEQRHSMLAGPQGAIVTEVATYHDMDALRFTHPDAKV